jgi:hypothetical protein
MFTITERNGKIKIYHKSTILELTREEADQLIVELQSFRKMLKWTVLIDYNTGKQNEIKGKKN